MKHYNDPEIKILLCDYREGITGWRHKSVFNSCWYFYWNNSPGAIIETGTSKHRLKPDKFYLIAPETMFSTECETPFNHFYLHFTAGAPFDQIKSKIYLFPTDNCVIKQIRMIQSFIPDRTLNFVHLSLLTHSIACSMLLKIGENEFQRLKRCDPRIEMAMNTLNKNTSEIISNEALAEDASMSVNGFVRLFMKELGITPQKYSRRKRIEKASILLHFTDKKIDEIAVETGFLDRYHFSRVFKETTNYSPAEFRKCRISF